MCVQLLLYLLPAVTLRKLAQRLCKKCSIGLQSNLKPGKHLPYEHVSMERVRSWVAFQIESGAIDPRVMANFDQVWSMAWRPRKKTLQKKGGEDGVDSIARSQQLRRARHLIQRFLDKPMTESLDIDSGVVNPPVVRGAAAANVPVEGFRQPRTLTTLSWSDGRLGRGFVTICSDQCSEKLREKMNKDCAWEKSVFYFPLSKLSENSEDL